MAQPVNEDAFGRGTLEFLRRLCDPNNVMTDLSRVAPDQGQLPAKCPHCQYLFSAKLYYGNLAPSLQIGYDDFEITTDEPPRKNPRYSHDDDGHPNEDDIPPTQPVTCSLELDEFEL